MGYLNTLKKQEQDLQRQHEELLAEEMASYQQPLFENGINYDPKDITLDFCMWLQRRAEVIFKP